MILAKSSCYLLFSSWVKWESTTPQTISLSYYSQPWWHTSRPSRLTAKSPTGNDVNLQHFDAMMSWSKLINLTNILRISRDPSIAATVGFMVSGLGDVAKNRRKANAKSPCLALPYPLTSFIRWIPLTVGIFIFIFFDHTRIPLALWRGLFIALGEA